MQNKVPDFFKNVIRNKIFWVIIILVIFIWVNNTSLFSDRNGKKITLVAHAALGQTYDLEGVKWDTNTAELIHVPEHPFIENTIPSIQAAFDFGADIVEFDIRLTADNQLAVFHDFLLDYRTDGTGNLSEHTMAELRLLDVGYGYTADGGKSYALRGTGEGMMVTMEEVIDAFPGKQFLIHIKDDGEEISTVLLDYLSTLDQLEVRNLSAYGNDYALDLLKEQYPEMKVYSRSRLIRAFLPYMAVGWTGFIPPAMRDMELNIPVQYARFMWGWPDKFLQRMDRVNTRVVLVRYVDGWSDGFDSEEDLAELPDGYTGGILTNRIDIIGSCVK